MTNHEPERCCVDRASLRARRLAVGLSQEKLARLADCSTNTIRTLERAPVRKPSTLDRIDRALREAESDS